MSSVYETEPMYYKDQSWFLNCVVVLETDLRPRELLERLLAIEDQLGRHRGGDSTRRYGPRVIDLDILFYGDAIVSEPGLEIPHPKIAERLFVLVPLNEVRPRMVHPVSRRSLSELLSAVRTDEQVKKKPKLLDDLAASLSLSPRRP